MRTYPFTHSEQFRRSKTFAPPTFTPHNPNTILRLRLFAAGLSTAALLAFIYSVSLSVEPVLVSIGLPDSVHEPLGNSYSPRCSADGRYVVFASEAANWIDNDTNNQTDIFRRDTTSGETILVSCRSDGGQSNGLSSSPDISGDGRFVVFTSSAKNLTNDTLTNETAVFLRDLNTGITTCISNQYSSDYPSEPGKPRISNNGNIIVYEHLPLYDEMATRFFTILRYSQQSRLTTCISKALNGAEANNHCHNPTLSADGRFTVFTSNASNLVVSDTNNVSDVFRADAESGTIDRLSVTSDGSQADGYDSILSANGRYVLFTSGAANLRRPDNSNIIQPCVRNTDTNTTVLLSTAWVNQFIQPRIQLNAISADGRFSLLSIRHKLLVPGSTNTYNQASSLVEIDTVLNDHKFIINGVSITQAVSACYFYDNSNMFLAANATEFDPNNPFPIRLIYHYARINDKLTPLKVSTNRSVVNSDAIIPSISSSGQYVAFSCNGSNLTPEISRHRQRIYRRNMFESQCELVSQADNNDFSTADWDASISGNGQYIAYVKEPLDNRISPWNGAIHGVYLRDMTSGTHELISKSASGIGSDSAIDPGSVKISQNGAFCVYVTRAKNLVSNDTNNSSDCFVYDVQHQKTTRLISPDNLQWEGDSSSPSISGDGLFVTYLQSQTAGVGNSADSQANIYLHNLKTNLTNCISTAPSGEKANQSSSAHMISADGNHIVFTSWASNLVTNDTNEKSDIFICHIPSGLVKRINFAPDGSQANANSWLPKISGDGRYVIYNSEATNLVSPNISDSTRLYLFDAQTQITTLITQEFNQHIADVNSSEFDLSASGRFLAFSSIFTVMPDSVWANRSAVYHLPLTPNYSLGQLRADTPTEPSSPQDQPNLQTSGKCGTGSLVTFMLMGLIGVISLRRRSFV